MGIKELKLILSIYICYRRWKLRWFEISFTFYSGTQESILAIQTLYNFILPCSLGFQKSRPSTSSSICGRAFRHIDWEFTRFVETR